MPELRTGFDYHLAEAQPVEHPEKGWEAYCAACGWAGPLRSTKSAAEEDCLAHDTAENA